MTSNQDALRALDMLAQPENRDIFEYIKSFNSDEGFMYTIETEPARIQLKKKMEKLLEGRHSGYSFATMLRIVQALMNGDTTKEQVLARIEEDKRRYAVWCRENNVEMINFDQ